MQLLSSLWWLQRGSLSLLCPRLEVCIEAKFVGLFESPGKVHCFTGERWLRVWKTDGSGLMFLLAPGSVSAASHAVEL